MRTRFLVQGIVDNATGDLYLIADQVRDKAHASVEASAGTIGVGSIVL
jgi:hypothetical protein